MINLIFLELPRPTNPINEADILYLVSAFKNATKNPNYRSALQVILHYLLVAFKSCSCDNITVVVANLLLLLNVFCNKF